MKTEETTEILLDVLHEVAPDADLSALAADADLRESLELDSLDFLRVVELLSEQTGHDIREDEYPRLATFGSTVEFLSGR